MDPVSHPLLRPVLRLVLALLVVAALSACEQKPPPVPAVRAPATAPEATAREQQPPAAGGARQSVTATPEARQRAADAELAAKVKAALVADPEVNALEIDVVAAQGAVTLFGTAPTRGSREKAARVASGIEGVKSVTNKLAVVAGS